MFLDNLREVIVVIAKDVLELTVLSRAGIHVEQIGFEPEELISLKE